VKSTKPNEARAVDRERAFDPATIGADRGLRDVERGEGAIFFFHLDGFERGEDADERRAGGDEVNAGRDAEAATRDFD
jgi:hypothetical protein